MYCYHVDKHHYYIEINSYGSSGQLIDDMD